MDLLSLDPSQFIVLTPVSVAFLLAVGFVGGLVSGFIGSGGAFILTPGMMGLGVPGAVAVASNMCHKFPKAMVGAIKRYRFGQVDVKLGMVIAATAGIGVQIGIRIQRFILENWGQAGSDLYVSVSFVVVLVVVGSYILKDALHSSHSGKEDDESTPPLAKKLQAINLPPMMSFPKSGLRISLWFTLPVGIATGMLAATIAVGGFVGVPGLIYVIGVPGLIASGTELVTAFVMGLCGSVNWAMHGMIDIRLVFIILAGSLLGVQLGAIGTTYVKPIMIKYVMAAIMLIVAASRIVALPGYLSALGLIQMGPGILYLLKVVSFITMCAGLLVGAGMILGGMWRGQKRNRKEAALGSAV